MTINFINLFNY